MVHPLEDFTDSCRIDWPYNISSCVREQIVQDTNNYRVYKLGTIELLSDEQKEEARLLDILFNLGFPEKVVGTYLYKDMIMKIKQVLNGANLNSNCNEQELFGLVQDPFSQFYLELAKFDLDIGIKSFHMHIEDMLSKCEFNTVDKSLAEKIFDDDIDYGTYAIAIANYLNTFGEDEHKNNTDKQFVKSVNVAVVAQK